MCKRVIGLTLIFFLLPQAIHAETGPTIKELLEKASPGEVIYLENRTYNEDVVIQKPVHLIGQKGTIIQGTGTKDVISLEADGIQLEHVTITNSSTNLTKDYAGIKVHSNENKITNVTIKDSLHGIYLNESKQNVLKNNTILGKLDINQSRRGNGIHLFHSSNNYLTGNTIDGARDGIYFSFAGENHIDKNTITNTRYGLHYMYSDHNTFFANEFHENVGGAAIMYSDFITLKENKFYDHHGLQSFGILLQTANDVLLESNDIHYNQKGIFMDQSYRNTFVNNQITNNRIGLDIWASSKNNTFTKNSILKNNLTYTSNGGTDANTWSVDGYGNAWSDHNFVDLDQNGRGDAPFVYGSSYGKVIADKPLGVLFLDSPALMIYEKWNQLFTSADMIQDDHPLRSGQTSNAFPFWLWVVPIGFAVVFQKGYDKTRRS